MGENSALPGGVTERFVKFVKHAFPIEEISSLLTSHKIIKFEKESDHYESCYLPARIN